MAKSYITKQNVFQLWEDAKEKTDQLTEPFEEFERIARNKPAEDADPAYPNVTDGTTASIIQKTPKRVVQQIPTGLIESDDADEWLHVVAEYIYLNKILPYANEDYSLFEKAQLIIESGLGFGFGLSFTPFLNHHGYFCPDMTLPYWGDIYPQPGKRSGRSCEYVFIRTWWQKEDIDYLISSEKEYARKAKAEGRQYESTWDLQALEAVKNKESSKDEQATTPNEDDRGGDNSGVEFVTAYQNGVGAKFYTIVPGTKKCVRTKTNKDPRGKMPLDWFYGDIDGTNVFGRSIVDLIGGLQNLIDSDMQAYQYNRALALQPPVVKYGNMGDFKFAPNVVIDAKNDPNAKIVPLTVDTTALNNYPALYGLQKSQLLNLAMSPDTSISASVGNPGFSKTPAGINQQQAIISVDDNTIRKRFEAWFESWSETAINMYFAERTGVEMLQLDDKAALKLKKLAQDGKFDLKKLNKNNQLIINYDEATPALKFRVNASTSKMADDQTKREGLIATREFIDSSQFLQRVIPIEKQLEIYNSFVALSGVEDPEKLSVDVDEIKQQQENAKANPEGEPRIDYSDAPEPLKRQMEQREGYQPSTEPSPKYLEMLLKGQELQLKKQQLANEVRNDQIDQRQEDRKMAIEQANQEMPERSFSDDQLNLIQRLRQLGFDDSLIAEATVLVEMGHSEPEVLAKLGVAQEANSG